MHRLALIAFLPLTVWLSSCQTLGLTSSTPADVVADPGPICPATAVLSDATIVTKLKPGTPAAAAGPAAANVAFTAEMSQAKLNCNYDRSQNSLNVDIEFAIRAKRGPAAQGPDPQIDFFVAVVDDDNNLISKRVFSAKPAIGSGAATTSTQTVDNFPVPLAMDKRPYDYEILTGFQLTPDELAYNRIPKSLPAPRAAAR
jgi:hypothetical protein